MRESRIGRGGTWTTARPAYLAFSRRNGVVPARRVGAQSAADAILTGYMPQILNAAMQAGICLDLTVGIDYCAMTMARFLTDQNTAFSRVKVEPCRRGPDIENLFINVASAFTSAL